VIGMPVDPARLEGHDDVGAHLADLADQLRDDRGAVGVHERPRMPVLRRPRHARVAVPEEADVAHAQGPGRGPQLRFAHGA